MNAHGFDSVLSVHENEWHPHKDNVSLEKLTRYTEELSNLVYRFGGNILRVQLNSLIALFWESEPLNCALRIQTEFSEDFNAVSIDHPPSVVIDEIEISNILNFNQCPEYKRILRIGQSAFERQVLISQRTLAKYEIPASVQVIDFGIQTFTDEDEPIHLLKLIQNKY